VEPCRIHNDAAYGEANSAMFNRLNITLLCILTVSSWNAQAQQCPAYAHLSTTIGVRDSLPDGWIVFGQSTPKGLFKCNTRSGAATVIPNTGSDQIVDIDISDDGKWIMYVANGTPHNKIYVIAPDGSGKTAIPDSIDNTGGWRISFPPNAQFYHWSPYGYEIAYYGGLGRIRSAAFHVDSAGDIRYDTTRDIANFYTIDSVVNWYMADQLCFYTQFSVSKNRIFNALEIVVPPDTANPPANDRTSFVTIPDQGLGTAGRANVYKWLNDDYKAWFGCGLTMSWDGSLCLANSNAVGDSSCVPTQKSNPTMDHKGFYVTRFMYDTMAPIARDSVIMSPAYGVSINWCPEKYRLGTYDKLGFTSWSFSNNNKWVVGEQEGSQASAKGVWVVNIPTNTWTQVDTVTGATNVLAPAMYFPGMSSLGVQQGKLNKASNPAAGSSSRLRMTGASTQITMEPKMYKIELYSLSGKLLWQYNRNHAGTRFSLELPRRFENSGALIIRYVSDKR
jgi:hypothetical protein